MGDKLSSMGDKLSGFKTDFAKTPEEQQMAMLLGGLRGLQQQSNQMTPIGHGYFVNTSNPMGGMTQGMMSGLAKQRLADALYGRNRDDKLSDIEDSRQFDKEMAEIGLENSLTLNTRRHSNALERMTESDILADENAERKRRWSLDDFWRDRRLTLDDREDDRLYKEEQRILDLAEKDALTSAITKDSTAQKVEKELKIREKAALEAEQKRQQAIRYAEAVRRAQEMMPVDPLLKGTPDAQPLPLTNDKRRLLEKMIYADVPVDEAVGRLGLQPPPADDITSLSSLVDRDLNAPDPEQQRINKLLAEAGNILPSMTADEISTRIASLAPILEKDRTFWFDPPEVKRAKSVHEKLHRQLKPSGASADQLMTPWAIDRRIEQLQEEIARETYGQELQGAGGYVPSRGYVPNLAAGRVEKMREQLKELEERKRALLGMPGEERAIRSRIQDVQGVVNRADGGR